jgi:uncharacterized protein
MKDQIAHSLNIKPDSVQVVLDLTSEGSTVPFIARYRKDRTGGLDEVQIQSIIDLARQIETFNERKDAIIKSITEQEKMTPQLMEKLNAATTVSELEDIYLPYKPKRKTKAMAARELGLQPLADWLLQTGDKNPEEEAKKYISGQVVSDAAALQGARDIIAEQINEDLSVRDKMRKLFEQEAQMISKVIADKETEAAKYRDYFDYAEPIAKIPSHRILAILRGFLAGFLRIEIAPSDENALALIHEAYKPVTHYVAEHIAKAGRDAYKRLLQPAMETEFRTALKLRADEEAIQVFAENLRQLLLSAPLGGKRLLAIDPGYRTGCKIVCLSENGELLENNLIYVHEDRLLEKSGSLIKELVSKYKIEAIAIGDGTAGRETETFIRTLELNLPVFMVNEDGASIYSASELARQEFPDHDVTVRGAVSIGRRLMDPLAELVKLDPKSIGVGQYQHDVNQPRLKEKLDQTVASCVNKVGVNINTASKQLLTYVSGIGPAIADQVVSYRKANGGFRSKKDLLNVPRLGEKAFEQSAGFIRIPEAEDPLDRSAVHPETFSIVREMAKKSGAALSTLIGNKTLLSKIDLKEFVTDNVGILTLKDIIKELEKPGLDPREKISEFKFAAVYSIDDIHEGMVLPGLVTNLTKFGAFVDIGVKQDGLVHISEIADRFISDPAQVLKLNQEVQVKITQVDVARKRIQLSIKQAMEGRQEIKQQFQKNANLQGGSLQDSLDQLKHRFSKK